MGIALELGIILGVRCASGGMAPLILIPVVALIVLATMLHQPLRAVLLLAVAGCLVGTAAGWLQSDEPLPALATDTPRVIVGRVMSDPQLEHDGLSAEIRWIDAEGLRRTSLLFAPATPLIERGQRVAFTGRVQTATGSLIFAEQLRIIDGATEATRLRNRVRSWITLTISESVPGSSGSLAL